MRSISDSRRKRRRGRPKTGIGKAIGLRLYPDLDRELTSWIKAQPAPRPSKPEAIRQLLQQALRNSSSDARQIGPNKAKHRAAELASNEIDRLGAQGATHEERAQRKRRLIKGPREFRDLRENPSKTK